MGHGVPDDVQIERPLQNENADTVDEDGNRFPACIWLIYQAKLRFSISLMLKEVMALCHLTFMKVSVNFVWTILKVDTLMRQQDLAFSASDLLHVYTVVQSKRYPNTNLLKGNHYLRLRNPRHPHTRMVTKIPNKDLYVDENVWVLGS